MEEKESPRIYSDEAEAPTPVVVAEPQRTGVVVVTVWQNNQSGEVMLHQLSDCVDDGTPEEQIARIAQLEPFAGFSCVSSDFSGELPDGDPKLWRWSGDAIWVDAPAPAVPASITRRQCARQLFAMGMITGPEAVAMTRDGSPPSMVLAYFDQLSGDQRFIAEMDFAADNYYRDNPLLNQIMAAGGHQPADVDAFFIAAAAL